MCAMGTAGFHLSKPRVQPEHQPTKGPLLEQDFGVIHPMPKVNCVIS